MARETIAVDFDDVLHPFTEGFVDWHNKEYGTAVAVEDIKTYNMEPYFGITPEEIALRLRTYHKEDLSDITPKPGVCDSVNELSADYNLVILTARSKWLRQRTERWAEDHFPGIFKDFILVGHHSGIEVTRTKGEVCADIGAVALIDDSPNNIASLDGKGVQGVLFGTHPWLFGLRVRKGHVRKRTWPEVVGHFKSESR